MQQFKALDRCSGTGILEEKHGGKSGSQCNDAVEEFNYGEYESCPNCGGEHMLFRIGADYD